MKINGMRIVLALGLGLMMLCPERSSAEQSQPIKFLVQDFEAFQQSCPGPASSYSPSCANQLAELKRRQTELHMSDADLAEAVLVYDINKFIGDCSAPYSQTCADARADLKRRQQALHLTSKDLQAAGVVVTRGIRPDYGDLY